MNAHTMKRWIGITLVGLLAGFGCKKQSAGPSASIDQAPKTAETAERDVATNNPGNVASLAKEISEGVGEVQQSIPQGAIGPVLVFEEYHTSRVGQLQIGVMLLRLHERYGLKLIGLEGALQRPQPLDAGWFQRAGGTAGQTLREDTGLRMLAEGEISAAEFMALLFGQVQVRGLEVEKEYGILPESEGSPVATYLLKIAEKKLTQSDIRRINSLISDKKQKEALEYIKNSDPWVRRQFEVFNQKSISTPELAKQIREIQDQAQRLGVEAEPGVKDGLQKTLDFYETASKRSSTMTSYLVNLLGSSPTAPVAMIIGAAHSKEVIAQLKSADISCALLHPIAFNPTFANLSMDEFERKNRLKWARITNGTLGRILNSYHKPPPFIETPTAHSYASAYMAVMLVSEAARVGKRVPDDVKTELAGLPELQVDLDSFQQVDGYDVIFRMWLTGTDGQKKEVWARAGTADTRERARTLEQELLQAIADLGGGGGMPPGKPPRESVASGDSEGPGDGKRGDVLISRAGFRSLVVFAESKEKVTAVGRISD